MIQNTLKNLIGASLIAVLAACASQSARGFDVVETAAPQPLAQFQNVYIAPVEVALDPREANRRLGVPNRNLGIPQEDRDDRAEVLRKELARAFAETHTVLESPSADALTIRATLTKIEPTRPTVAQLGNEIFLSDPAPIAAGGGDVEFELVSGDTTLARLEDSFQSLLIDPVPRVSTWADLDRAYDAWTTDLVDYVQKN